MKPCLVDLNDFLKENKSIENEIKIKKPLPKKIEKNLNIKSIFNIFGLLFILIGILFLIKRKEKKEEKRKELEEKINKLKNIIEINN